MKKKIDDIELVLERAARVVENLPEWMTRIEKRSKQEYLSRHQFTNPKPQERKVENVGREDNQLSAQ